MGENGVLRSVKVSSFIFLQRSLLITVLRDKNHLPIYTLAMPGSKIYVINSIELIAAAQRYPKTLAFPPIEAKMGIRLNSTSGAANKIIMTNVNGEEGDWGLSIDVYKSMRTSMAPSTYLDSMSRMMMKNVAASMEKLCTPQGGSKRRIGLAQWLRHEITLATTNAVYGPANPFLYGEVEASFW